MTIDIAFDNSYANLPDQFFSRTRPTPVADPQIIAINETLADSLGFDAHALQSPQGVDMFAGNFVPNGADPIAQAYAGHQFGGWSPQLGDGRAVLLGEIIDINGIQRDIQLKGSGRTPFSRAGDGRAWLGPVLREYLISEAMHALGIPTTRALAAVLSGEMVQREHALPGAVLTRVASSHIRVGTFQYFAARQDKEALQKLYAFVVNRHYPSAETPLKLLEQVIKRHAKLISQWMGVGFIHGVMNTDNSHIAGETIDYGPCAFMDNFHPETVYSSIDRYGRYAYGKQPEIAVWNLAQLATALLPIIDEDLNRGVEKATEVVHQFPNLYRDEWLKVFGGKLGLENPDESDQKLIEELLKLMANNNADFTNTFRSLGDDASSKTLDETVGFDNWLNRWAARAPNKKLMAQSNPAVIPRNHQVEIMIQEAISGNYDPLFKLNKLLANPFDLSAENAHYAKPPAPSEVVKATFCGT